MRGMGLLWLRVGLILLATGRLAFPAEPEPKRLTVAEAQALIRSDLKPGPDVGFNPADAFSLQEWKDEALWGRLHAQVFRVVQNNWPYATVLVRGKQILALGIAFGGLGVESLCVTDLDGDKQPDLLFTYAWGSGIHRAQLGILRFGPEPLKWEDMGLCLLHGDLALERVSDQAVKVLRAQIRWGPNLDKAADGAVVELGAVLATVAFDPAKRQIVVKAADGLDARTRKNLLIGTPKDESAK